MRLKRIERQVKHAASAAIAALMGRSSTGDRPDWRARPHRVLFLRHDKIGDMILSTGVLRAIGESHPDIQLDVLASPSNAAVLRQLPYVHEIIPFDRHAPVTYASIFRSLRRRRYDAVIDCMIMAPSLTTLLLMLASGARHRIGVAALGNDFAYTLRVPASDAPHLVDKLGALASAFDLQPAALDLRPRIRLTAAERERGERAWIEVAGGSSRGLRILVNISAGRANHAWLDDRYAVVIRAARAHVPSAAIGIVSTPNDRLRARGIAAATGERLLQDEGLRDAMAIVAAADIVFTPDTSISHMASAFDKPAVVLHPRGYAALWGPYRTSGQSVESVTNEVAGISVAEAKEAMGRALDALTAETP